MKQKTGSRLIDRIGRVHGWFRQDVDLFMLVILASWSVAELAEEVVQGTTQRYDEWVLRQLRSPTDRTNPIGPAWFQDMWRDVTAVGSVTVLAVVTMACTGYLLLRKQYHVLAFLLAAIVGSPILSLLLKGLFGRPRPEFASPATHVTTSSFPSSHSMLSAVVYLTLGALLARTTTQFRYKLYFIATALMITVLVGISRIYLGVHYPTDVLAGWSFGLIWALLCWLIARFLRNRGTTEPLDGSS